VQNKALLKQIAARGTHLVVDLAPTVNRGPVSVFLYL
jgi:hypothetical protein